ncbi:MAG: hypothetical protein ACHQ4G_08125 [Opitutales bacterium]
MNKKTKTMFVMQPGGFGSGATIFSSYEFEDNSVSEADRAPVAESKTTVAPQTTENRNWTQAVVRLPEAFHRSVWKPLTRRVQNLGRAA